MSKEKPSQGIKSSALQSESKSEWEFDAVVKNSLPKKEQLKVSNHLENKERAQNKLALDENAVPKSRTRSAMARDMQIEDDENLDDIISLATIVKRSVAFAIDTIFLIGLISFTKYTAPLWRKLLQYLLDSYKYKLIIPESVVMYIILGLAGFCLLFALIIIPISFFNTTIGKKIVGLQVRGDKKYSISLTQAMSREFIMKPISILIIAGFITPFISKKRLSIHDMVCNTIVVDD
jgi:uncharacterized RDD family membrane protein YckC